MASCELNTNSIDIVNGAISSRLMVNTIKFDGFMKVYDYTTEDDEKMLLLPELEEGEDIKTCIV